jgi:hypothetical protein
MIRLILDHHGRMARGGHGLPQVLPGLPLKRPYGRFRGGLRPTSTPLDKPLRMTIDLGSPEPDGGTWGAFSTTALDDGASKATNCKNI